MTKQTLSIIGVGAFGEFALRHLAPHFDITLYDAHRDIAFLEDDNINITQSLSNALHSEIVIFAVPIQALEKTLIESAPFLKKGQLILDVASVKVKPIKSMIEHLPDHIDIIATHPIFGPQSGKNGIEGQNITLVNVRGNRLASVQNFLSENLKLNVIISTADEHDLQMAYVQGLTHMVARIFKMMDVPELNQTTKTYTHLQDMVNLINNDSDDLFRAIQTENPYVHDVKKRFFSQVKNLEEMLSD
jgi:prephenate dehydrogenase